MWYGWATEKHTSACTCIYILYNFFIISPHLRRGPPSIPSFYEQRTKAQYADPNSSIAGHIIPGSSFHRQFTMEAIKSPPNGVNLLHIGVSDEDAFQANFQQLLLYIMKFYRSTARSGRYILHPADLIWPPRKEEWMPATSVLLWNITLNITVVFVVLQNNSYNK